MYDLDALHKALIMHSNDYMHHTISATGWAQSASAGGRPCDCADDESVAGEPDHECCSHDLDECLRLAETYAKLAAAAASMAATTQALIASEQR